MTMIQKVSPYSTRYYVFNFIAAIMLLASLFVHRNLPSIFIEFFWLGVSVYGIKKNWGKDRPYFIVDKSIDLN